jgi:hypothetical protein
MSSFSIDLDDPKEAWEALCREIEASVGPEPDAGSLVVATAERLPFAPAEDLSGWLWLMHACGADDVS